MSEVGLNSNMSQTLSKDQRCAQISDRNLPPDRHRKTNTKEKSSVTCQLSKHMWYVLPITIATAVTLTHLAKGKVFSISKIVSQQVSLREAYRADYEKLLEERKRNMKKYSYPYNMNGVDKRSQLSLQEFNDIYNGKWPVVITDVISSWPAANWTPEYFLQNYHMDKVTMKTVNINLDIAISEVLSSLPDLNLFHTTLEQNLPHTRLHVQGGLEQAVSLALPLHVFHKYSQSVSPDRWAYVEDELFIPMRPQLYSDLGQTVYLEEDYFRLWPEEVRPWNAMLLWGTAYSRSSLHIDPYNWTGTNAVISGRKLWKLYPPGQDQYLYVKPNQYSGFPLDALKYNSPIDAWNPDLEQYPLFQQVRTIELEQLPGELLIIPTGWFHQAFNSEETIAVSSQVMNSHNWRIVMEEIIKTGDNVPRQRVPVNIDKLPPQEQILHIMSMLPQHILERGKAVTRNVLHQILHGFDDMYSPPLH